MVQDVREWPIIEALPSYGRGRERSGGRHISLIHGHGLQDVVITGTLFLSSSSSLSSSQVITINHLLNFLYIYIYI